MSYIYREDEFKQLKAVYKQEFDKIQVYETRRKLTNNVELLKGYRKDIVQKHNYLSSYIRNSYKSIQEKGIEKVKLAEKVSCIYTTHI